MTAIQELPNLPNLSPIINGLFSLVDNLFTTDEEREQARIKIMSMYQAGQLAQLEVNKVEASSNNAFVAGWRPFIGWVCGVAFAWAFILFPVFTWLVTAFGLPVDVTLLPSPDLGEMLPVLMGMLGLGTLRTYEKKHGIAKGAIEQSKAGLKAGLKDEFIPRYSPGSLGKAAEAKNWSIY